MRRARRRRNVAILVGVIILAIVIALFFMPSSKDKDKEYLDIETHDLTEEIKDEKKEEPADKEPVVEEKKEEPVKEEPKQETKDELTLCNDFIMEQGDELIIEGNTIVLEKIAKSSVKMTVNGNRLALSEDDYEKEDSIGLFVEEDKIVFFEEDHEENSIQIRIGCSSGETPNDKVVKETLKEDGIEICTEISQMCEEKFIKPDKDDYENITEFDFCDEYNLKQGESEELGDYKITLQKISKDSVVVEVDSDNVILKPNEYTRVNDLGLKVEGIFFFEEDDPENELDIEIGCKGEGKSDSEVIDKSIWSQANKACEDLIELCEEKFDVEI